MKINARLFGPIIVLAAALALASGCSMWARLTYGPPFTTPSPQPPDPLASWTFYSFPGWGPNPNGHNNNILNSTITIDYENFIKTNNLGLMGAITGYYEDGNGQHAIEFVASPPKLNATWNYVLIYDKDNKRTKVIKYNYSGVYQS